MYKLIKFFCAPYMWIMGWRHRRHSHTDKADDGTITRTVRAELLPRAKQILLQVREYKITFKNKKI